MCATMINLGLMINAGMLLAPREMLIFSVPVIALGFNWEEFIRCQVRANETYLEAKRQFRARNINLLMNAQSPYKWWSTVKSAVFGFSLSLPPLVGGGGGQVCESH